MPGNYKTETKVVHTEIVYYDQDGWVVDVDNLEDHSTISESDPEPITTEEFNKFYDPVVDA